MSQDFDDADYVSCPSGGDWARCADVNYPTFIGCCSQNPCGGQMCAAEDHFPMSFGNVTEPVPDYPNHSCPYGGLWYTCALNTVPFQGCCASNPCNGEGCPAADLRQAALATVEVAGGSTFTVPPTVALPTTTSTPDDSGDSGGSTNVAAIAGGAAAGVVAFIAIVGIVYYCFRRKRKQQAAMAKSNSPYQGVYQDGKGYYRDATGNAMTPLPHYPDSMNSPVNSPGHPHSPAPEYMQYQSKPRPEGPPQEIMGLGLSRDEYQRRHQSREPKMATGGPVELPSGETPAALHSQLHEAESPLMDVQSQTISSVRSSQLRNSEGYSQAEPTLSSGPSPRLQ